MTRVAHIQPIATGGKPPEGSAVVPEAACGAVGWQASANHNRLFHSALNTPSPLRACPTPAGGGLGRGFSVGIEEQLTQNKPETNRFFYHPDHLGSSSFITDADGEGYQHLQYLPFGETAVSQKLSWWSTPYQFTGKEKDDETGYNYFGARYYNSDVSVWLSVDPMSDKHPDYTPFAYCYNNPIRFIDPIGLDTILPQAQGGFGVYLPSNATNIATSKNPTGRGSVTGNVIGLNVGGLLSFSIEDRHFAAKFNVSTGEFINYQDQNGQAFIQYDYLPLGLQRQLTSAIGLFSSDPDLIMIEVGLSSTFIRGAEKSWTLNFLNRGPERGVFFTTYEAESKGFEVDFGGAVSALWYVGSRPQIRRQDVLGRMEKASLSLGPIPVSIQYIWSRDENNNRNWQGVSVGGGFGYGATYRDGQTTPITN